MNVGNKAEYVLLKGCAKTWNDFDSKSHLYYGTTDNIRNNLGTPSVICVCVCARVRVWFGLVSHRLCNWISWQRFCRITIIWRSQTSLQQNELWIYCSLYLAGYLLLFTLYVHCINFCNNSNYGVLGKFYRDSAVLNSDACLLFTVNWLCFYVSCLWNCAYWTTGVFLLEWLYNTCVPCFNSSWNGNLRLWGILIICWCNNYHTLTR